MIEVSLGEDMQQSLQPMDRNMMRVMNQNMLLNLIRTYGPVSRTQLKKLSGLSLGTIVGLTATLIQQQFVTEVGMAESTGGRKAELLEIYPAGGYVIGIDLREHEIIGAVLNLHGQVVYSEFWPAQLRDNPSEAVALLAIGIEAFIAHSQIPRGKFLGLGCGVPGPVNAQTGTSIDSWILNWHDVELSNPLSQQLNMPVFVENAVNCFASYENLYGNGHNYQNFLLITLGRGLGFAMVIHNDLYRGAQGVGAEFGHIPFDTQGRYCECGNQGCLEAYISHHGIFNTYRELCSAPANIKAGYIDGVMINELFAQAQQGDLQALKTFELTGNYLGIGLATLTNLFNPECIIVNSDEGQWLDLLMESARSTMKQHIFSKLGNNLEIIIERNTTELNWARGAGCLVLRDFFSSLMKG